MEAAISTLKNHLPEIVHQVESGEDIQITRHGKPVAVMVSLSRYQQAFGDRKDIYQSILRWRNENPDCTGFTDEELHAMRDVGPHESRPSVWD